MAGNFYQVSPLLVNQSLGSTFTSSASSVGQFDNISIQSVITDASSLNGSLQLQHSVDGVTFVDLNSPTALTTNTAFITQLQNVAVGYIRFVYTRTAGTGTLNVKVGSVNRQ